MEYQRDEHRMHLIVSHLIWCPWRRRPILTGKMAQACRALLEQKCKEQRWHILELAIQIDHIHLFVRVLPTTSAALMAKECKGSTAFHLRRTFPFLQKWPSRWTRSYCASTAGNVSSDTIRCYLEAQKGQEAHRLMAQAMANPPDRLG